MKHKHNFLRLISAITAISISILCCGIMSVSAAQYSGGSGTRKDPYLIKTADDLYNMRNNLSASFKLAATIDMSGYKTDSKYFNGGFVPIGDDSTKPFTGSFTCDLASDGLPLYAILNLNIYNKKGELFNHDWYGVADYPDALGQDPPYYYQTALFGTTDGANISNIYVLNAEIYSSVVGQHSGRYADGSEGSLISYSAFMDTQATAVLIGEAVNTTVSHCAATGEVNGKTSGHGGLIGSIVDSNVSDSYTDVNIDTGGCWSVGNFAGKTSGMTTITNCFSLGKLNASLDGYGKMGEYKQNSGSGAGGFIGSINETGTMIQNCWSGVELTSKTKGNNFFGILQFNASVDQIVNCFSFGAYEGKSSAPIGTQNQNNCYISTASNGLQIEFNAASPEEITKYFTGQKGWEKGDKYPVLTATDVVEDTGMFVPGVDREKPADNSANTGSEVTVGDEENSEASVSDTQSGTAEDNAAESEATVETVTEANDELDTIQLVFIVLLTVMIIGISVIVIIMVYNTLRVGKNLEEIEGDEQDEE